MRGPVTVNDAALPAPLFEWRELRSYYDFLALLVWRETHLRYRHTLVGIGWSFMNPLLTMAVFGLIVPNLMSRQQLAAYTHSIPYPLYVFCGLVPWNCFSHALTRSTTCLVDQSALVKNMYFPRITLPLSKVLAACVDLLINLIVLLLVLMLIMRVPPSLNLFFVPLLLLPLLACALGLGMIVGILQPRYRDIFFVMQFVIQLGLLVTPVWFPLEALSANLQWVIAANPMTGVVQGFRWAVLGAPAPPASLMAVSSLAAFVVLGCALFFFRKRQETIADYV